MRARILKTLFARHETEIEAKLQNLFEYYFNNKGVSNYEFGVNREIAIEISEEVIDFLKENDEKKQGAPMSYRLERS